MSALGAQSTPRHNVFVSYRHANDEAYKTNFVDYFANQTKDIISRSVEIGNIDSNLPAETIRVNIHASLTSTSFHQGVAESVVRFLEDCCSIAVHSVLQARRGRQSGHPVYRRKVR